MDSALASLVDKLGRGNPEVAALMVIDAGGRVHASDGVAPEVLRAAVAMVVPLREFLDRAAADLGCGVLRGTVVEGSDATFALADIDGDRTAVVVGASGAAIGSIRADALWLAAELRRGGAVA